MMLSVSFMLYDDDVGCIDRCTDVSHILYYCHQSLRKHLLVLMYHTYYYCHQTLIGHFCEGIFC
jgi:hypothetical protein